MDPRKQDTGQAPLGVVERGEKAQTISEAAAEAFPAPWQARALLLLLLLLLHNLLLLLTPPPPHSSSSSLLLSRSSPLPAHALAIVRGGERAWGLAQGARGGRERCRAGS